MALNPASDDLREAQAEIRRAREDCQLFPGLVAGALRTHR